MKTWKHGRDCQYPVEKRAPCMIGCVNIYEQLSIIRAPSPNVLYIPPQSTAVSPEISWIPTQKGKTQLNRECVFVCVYASISVCGALLGLLFSDERLCETVV